MVGAQPVPAHEHALDAVVRVGDCSGVVIAPDRVLTAAHCVVHAPPTIVVASVSVPVARCQLHPRFEAGSSAYDIAECILARPVSVRPIPAATSSAGVGEDVLLAGYGQRGAFDRMPATLRTVVTTAATAGPRALVVGTTDKTACMGDSGGPVLGRAGGGAELRVLAILQGPTGALCRSPTEAVTVWPDGVDWTAGLAPPSSRSPSAVFTSAVVGAPLAIVIALLLRRRAAAPAA